MKSKLSDREFARRCMPAGTRSMTSANGVRGYFYEFVTELGIRFSMFAYRNSYWQVMVLEPKLEDRYRNPHTGHLYGDGRICMGKRMNSGLRSLSEAYGKSVLWANGISAMLVKERESGRIPNFPFNFDD